MSLSQMQVFNQYVMPATIESLAQQIELFNAASQGMIVMSTDGFDGDFSESSFWNAIHSAQRRVDRYAANGTPSVTDLTQTKNAAVKIAGGFGPIRYEPSQLTWLNKPTTEAIEVASRNMAEALMADMVNSAIAALVAAISNQASATNDVSATAGISYGAFNDAHAKFGDASQQLVGMIMNGVAAHKMIGSNLTNTNRLFVAGNVQVMDILGKPVIVTDAPALYAAGSPNKLKVLSLRAGAAKVHNNGDIITNISTTNGLERIVTTMQTDYSFGLELDGYTWDETNGGKSPTDAEIATGSNWDLTAGNIKHSAGVVTIGDRALS
jgi:hypothetical protein